MDDASVIDLSDFDDDSDSDVRALHDSPPMTAQLKLRTTEETPANPRSTADATRERFDAHMGHNPSMSSEKPRRITIRRYASASEADRHDVDFWRQMSEAERVLQVWRLSEELWRLRGEPHEPGLCRSVARVHRR